LNEIPSFGTVNSSEYPNTYDTSVTLDWLSCVICPNNLFSVQAGCAKFQYGPIQLPQGLLKENWLV